jgi:hypothetical protein
MMLVPMEWETFYIATGLTGRDTIMRPFFSSHPLSLPRALDAVCTANSVRRSCCDRQSVSTKAKSVIHVYEVHSRKDKRGVGLISDALPFGRLDPVLHSTPVRFD